MTRRLVERFAVGAACRILLATPAGEIWVEGRVAAHAHPGVWVTTPGGRWFVTNGRRIEEIAAAPRAAPAPPFVCKILRADEWAVLDATGEFAGSPDDLRDGYIHLSAPEQVAGSLAKHFAGAAGVVVADVDPARLPPGALRWEPSRGGTLFPHLHAPLRRDAVVRVRPA
jgi:uncharacterized protein (DUF952 family)